jgi:hypothetical protein
MKRHVLKDTQEHPNWIYGLVCAKPFTQMVWNLCEMLDIPFERDIDITLKNKTETKHWPRFTFFDEDMETTYSIVKNKGVDNILAPELRNVDAFLIETNHSLTFQLSLDKVSQTSFIDFCFEVTPKMINEETDLLLYID